MAKQPTASRTALLLKCQWSFSDSVEIPPEESVGEAPRYGSAFHALLEAAPLELGKRFDEGPFGILVDATAKKWSLSRSVAEELAGHVRGSLPVLQKWLAGKNPFDMKFNVKALRREKSWAIKPFRGRRLIHAEAREIANPTTDGHVYEELKKGEIAGTEDLGDVGFVMDYKTGSQDHDFAKPAKNDQLRTLALASGASTTLVAIFHADRRGLPVIYADELEEDAHRSHARKLALALKRTNSGYLRPGPHCQYCPARTVCPTQTAALLQGAASLVDGGMTALATTSKSSAMEKPEDIGRLHQFFSEFDRLKEKAKPLMKARVKALLEDGKLSQRPDGKVLTIRTRSEERLSKKAIADALGSSEAERLFEKLRKAGALVTSESEGLYAEFPD